MIEPLTPEHYALVAEWLSDNQINRWLFSEWRGQTFDDRVVAALLMNKRNKAWLVTGKDEHGSDRPMGLVVLSQIDNKDRTAVVWFLKGDLRVQGHMSLAVEQAARDAFDSLALRSLSAFAMDTNHGSIRLLQRVGFKPVGRFRNGFFDGEGWVDRLAFDLVPKDLVS